MNYSASTSMIREFKLTELGWDGRRFHVMDRSTVEATVTPRRRSTSLPDATTASDVILPATYSTYTLENTGLISKRLEMPWVAAPMRNQHGYSN
jgi:hypothetical protein